MQKLLISVVGCASLALNACSGIPRQEQEIVYRSSILEDLPFVYKLTVQQGNVLNQDIVNRLELGMNKRQVRFVLGTPLLIDVFHENRWDYLTLETRGRETLERKRLTLYFDNDQLSRIEGDFKPEPGAASQGPGREAVVEVPDYRSDEGLFAKTLRTVGLEPPE